MGETILTMYHIPGCPFSERVEILLELKGLHAIMADVEIDISKPRPDWLLAKTRGTTALPALELDNGETLKESLVIMRYLERRFPDRPVMQADPYRSAVEEMLVAMDQVTGAGYRMILNRDREKAGALRAEVDGHWGKLDEFLSYHSPDGDFLFEDFRWAEACYAPMFKRLWFLEYYEDYEIPAAFGRARRWREIRRSSRTPNSSAGTSMARTSNGPSPRKSCPSIRRFVKSSCGSSATSRRCSPSCSHEPRTCPRDCAR